MTIFRRLKDPTNPPPPSKCSLTFDEIQAFQKQLEELPCAIPHMDQVQIKNFFSALSLSLPVFIAEEG